MTGRSGTTPSSSRSRRWLTLGLLTTRTGGSPAALLSPALKRTEEFSSSKVSPALEVRRGRAEPLLELDVAVGEAVK